MADAFDATMLYHRCGIPTRFHPKLSKVSKETEWYKMYRQVDHLATFETGAIVVLLGDFGTGKSQMGCQLVYNRCTHGLSALYVRTKDMLATIRGSFDDRSIREMDAAREFIHPTLLVMDEIQVRGESKWENDYITHIIDHRYAAMKETILIANLSMAKIHQHLAPSVLSRIKESGQICMCKWKSFRDN